MKQETINSIVDTLITEKIAYDWDEIEDSDIHLELQSSEEYIKAFEKIKFKTEEYSEYIGD